MSRPPFDLPLEDLRRRTSAKWRTYPEDVLPAFVAEMDVALAEPVRDVLETAVRTGDLGYQAASASDLAEAYAGFAGRRFGVEVDPARIQVCPDVMVAVVELLRRATRPGDRVIVNPPVYAPFHSCTEEAGCVVEAVPLREEHGRLGLDLEACERACAGGARAWLLCHPHNPTGATLSHDELVAVAAMAARHDVLVLSDEIHAPLVLPGAAHRPYVTSSPEAARTGVTLTSASKAFNLAGLKCALMSTAGEAPAALVAGLPYGVHARTGHLGVLAARAAFLDGEPWLDAVLEHLDTQRRRLGELLERELPGVRVQPPEAGYLAWLDCRALGLGDDPAAAFLRDGRVALSSGPSFGLGGAGHARLNVGTSAELLDEAIGRMARAVEAAAEPA